MNRVLHGAQLQPDEKHERSLRLFAGHRGRVTTGTDVLMEKPLEIALLTGMHRASFDNIARLIQYPG